MCCVYACGGGVGGSTGGGGGVSEPEMLHLDKFDLHEIVAKKV